ncbi:hypothetical protein [Propionimicrobium sp. PCR01-08-3]|uniref:hypothetical protein n=1 Tax=Propionimicrobium sp. PCR01-08-3 TaxID=3052086 RepID=UPI00255CFB7E|nr:hypothetical protein [Propionimicrobium sp. PCR01-08-3]WIY81443.1 hypothetical protein QQ658_07750 [Propionimicrobium sp. PCR01-08-3]
MKNHTALLVDALNKVFLAPIRSGRPRPSQWPAGLSPVMAVVGIGYLFGVVLVLGAPWLRAADRPVVIEGSQVLGSASMTVLLWLVSLTLALGLTAALHVHPLLKIVSLAVFLLPLTPQLALGGSLPVLGSMLGIVVFFLIRWRGRFVAWEFPVIWILVSIGVLRPLAVSGNYGYDMRTATLLLVLAFINSLAVPALMMTGYAAAQVGVSISQWMGLRLDQVLPVQATKLLAGLLAVGNVGYAMWSTYQGKLGWEAENWVGSLLLVTLTVGIVAGLLSRRPAIRTPDAGPRPAPAASSTTPRSHDPAAPDAIADSWVPQAFGLASATLAFMVLTAIAAIAGGLVDVFLGHQPDWLANLGSSNLLLFVVRFSQAGIALWWGWRRAGRGDRVTPVVLGAFGAIMIISSLSILTSSTWLAWEVEPVGILLLLAGVIAWFTFRSDAGAHYALIIALLATLFRFREPLSEPGMVFGVVSASAVLLISLIWRVLTDGDLMAGDSRALPGASRVMAFGTMALLAVLTLSVTAQMRVQTPAIDQSAMVGLGDATLGGALFLAAGVSTLTALWSARQADAHHRAAPALFNPR